VKKEKIRKTEQENKAVYEYDTFNLISPKNKRFTSPSNLNNYRRSNIKSP